jgi:hypothetical protein
LLAYLHAHRPSKAIGKNKLQKQKAWPSATPFSFSPFSLICISCSDQYSAVSLQQILKPIIEPILTPSQPSRSSIARGHNREIPEIH